MTTIKSCPFCGAKNTVLKSEGDHRICCAACGTDGPRYDSVDGAITLWNRRPSEDYWQEAATYLANVHAANCSDYTANSVSRSKKIRQHSILRTCADVLRGGTVPRTGYDTLEMKTKHTIERCETAIGYIQEALNKK